VRIAATAPRGWARWIAWRLARRGLAVTRASFDALAADVGARAFSPLLDRAFASALARQGGRLGSGDRGAVLQRFAAQVLPAELLARRDKATFDAVFWSEPSRRFRAQWDGSVVDEQLVDAEALRRVWTADEPDARTALLLQAAWLAAQAGA
jgi:asparagine synthase (glutamine-hydrolysing)